MTSSHTLPIPQQLPIPQRVSPQTARLHEHAWLAESRHQTSEGTIVYVRCTGCETRRVDIRTDTRMPPTALSRATHEIRR